jgi:hypothetical protein
LIGGEWSHGFLLCSVVFVAEASRTGRRWTCPGRRSSPEYRRRQSTSPAVEVCAGRPRRRPC